MRDRAFWVPATFTGKSVRLFLVVIPPALSGAEGTGMVPLFPPCALFA